MTGDQMPTGMSVVPTWRARAREGRLRGWSAAGGVIGGGVRAPLAKESSLEAREASSEMRRRSSRQS